MIEETKNMIQKHGIIGLGVAVLIGALVFQILLSVILSVLGKSPEYSSIINYFILTGNKTLFRPWTIFTYALIYPLSLQGLIGLLVDCMFFWSFGGMFMQLWGQERLRKYLIIMIPFLGICGAVLSLIMGNQLVYTAAPVIMAVVFSISFLTPDYPVSLWGVVQMKMVFFAFVALLIEFISWGASATGILILLGGLCGYLFTLQMKKGNDLTKIVFDAFRNLFQKKNRKGKFTVTVNPFEKKEEDTVISQEEIDEILDKISLSGYQSLTRQQKEKLEKFSGKRKTDN